MLIFIGYIAVIGSVLGGYLIVGGHLGVLVQPAEVIIIAGAAIGAFIASNNGKGIKATIRVFPRLRQAGKYNKTMFMNLMGLLYQLLAKGRSEGMMALERDIDNPEESPLFAEYPMLRSDPLLMEFLTDYLRLMISGNMDAFEIEALMDHEIETFRHEAEIPVHSLSSVGDGLPAFGIVAAVMGVVHALGAPDLAPEQLGPLIANAMVGTFLGILLAYGFVTPLASRIKHQVAEVEKMLQCIKVTLLANLNGYAPPISVEFGRKALFSSERPSFTELEEHVRSVRSQPTGGR
ncbi:flagellar motor stator protein MotA [Kushneria phosphatilytica]|uniref:Flagellar motor stator protein MotA n=1 Tax=Kushneria phosphatilytica TaxID=657387 RepID=A0A1S1NVQ2_9GAMM|nr:flagellar motor stator protein MotA [Kushneria phosphatilytica]OHV12041.1 flagellar motor stator protein MotA [Kushneria phosphatilytica]QEL11231.1 flagellar motor stator protein MotA [Kushneria phosphatilytica]